MKTLKLTLTMLLLSVAWSYAQYIPMIMVEKIKDEQVPAVVLQTFENEFDCIKADINGGAWYSHFEHTNATPGDQGKPGTSRAIPLHYSYKGKKDGKKVEIKFTPEGKLVHVKGLKAKSSIKPPLIEEGGFFKLN